MKRIAIVMLLTCALGAFAKFSAITHHWGQAYADDSGDTGDDSGDEDSGT
jgi:hypothetical protein